MYKRQDIFGTSPLDLKNLNDNIKYLWMKVFGDINMTDLADEVVQTIDTKVDDTTFNITIDDINQTLITKVSNDTFNSTIEQQANLIATKVDADGVKSTIQQSPTDIKIGFNQISNVIDIDASGIQVNHYDGSYTKMEGTGFKRYVNGTGKTYHSLYYTNTAVIISTPGNAGYADIQLPDEFKGTDFFVTAAFNACYTQDGLDHRLMSFSCFVAGGYLFDKANARIRIYASSSREGYAGESVNEIAYTVIA